MARMKLPKIDNLEFESEDGEVLTLVPITTRLLQEIESMGREAKKAEEEGREAEVGIALLDKQLSMYLNKPEEFFEPMPFSHKAFMVSQIQEFLESNMSKTLKKNK